MTRTFIGDLKNNVAETVSICGWISVVRDQEKMMFFDIRDMTGTVQTVVLPKSPVLELAKATSRESSVRVTGTVNKRPEKNIDHEIGIKERESQENGSSDEGISGGEKRVQE